MGAIDRVEKWNLSPEHESKFHSDLVAMSVLWFGLEHLYGVVAGAEQDVSTLRMTLTEESEAQARRIKVLARCAFDWYAVSACNLAALVAWMAAEAGLTTENQKSYVMRILPPVDIHRNKVAAHFSRHSPRKDQEALQRASTMWFSLSELNGRFFANTLVYRIGRGAATSDSTELKPWSLVEVHEALRQRYQDCAVTSPKGGLSLQT